MTKVVASYCRHLAPVGRCVVTTSENRLPLVKNNAIPDSKKREVKRVTNIAVYDEILAVEERCRYYSCLADYLEQLEGKEAYREFQERNNDDPEYYTLVASLAA